MKKREISRRGVLKGSADGRVIGGTGSFFGPWKHNRVWAQGAEKPIKLGLTWTPAASTATAARTTCAASAWRSRSSTPRAACSAARSSRSQDTETTPATGTRVAERLITREECALLIGALHSGVANAITQVAQQVRRDLPQHQLARADRGGRGLPPRQVRLGRQRHQLRQGHRQERDASRSARTGCC